MIVTGAAHVFDGTQRNGQCRRCGRPIVWARLSDGHDMQFDPPLYVLGEQLGLFDCRSVLEVDLGKSPFHDTTCPRRVRRRPS